MLTGKPSGMRDLGKARRKWEDREDGLILLLMGLLESPFDCGIGSISHGFIIIFINYAAYYQIHGLMENNIFLPYVRVKNFSFQFFDVQLLVLAPNSFFCLSDHQGAVFFFFLLLSLRSSVVQ